MSKFKVCLDAGHYGKYNRSPAVPAYYESVRMWDLHLMLKAELEKYGIEVVLTRADQAKDMELYKRGAASKGCDLFLSLHSNAVGSGVNESVDYVAVYHLTDDAGTTVDDKSKAFAKMVAPAIAETMGVKQGSKTLTRKASTDKNKDGFLNDNYYGVLNGARQVGTPGLILEHSFHTNTRSTNWLLDDANLSRLAEAEAKVVAEYFGVEDNSGTDNLVVNGVWDSTLTTRLQQIFGTTADGKVSNQWLKYMDQNPGLTSGWQWHTKPNGKGSQLIKAMQKWAGMSIFRRDGEIGPNTIKALQKKLGTTVDGYVSNPSQMVKALQRWANEQ